MADIFISYNRQDLPVAEQFVQALEAEGFDVWWDATLKSGDAYDEVTEAALRSARAVIVLWSQRSVKSRWVHAVAKALKVVLGVEQDRLASSPTNNPNAYDAFLKGRELFHRLSGQNTLPQAVEYFEQAVELDPDFGEAWLFLALAHFHLPDNTITDDVRGHYEAANTA